MKISKKPFLHVSLYESKTLNVVIYSDHLGVHKTDFREDAGYSTWHPFSFRWWPRKFPYEKKEKIRRWRWIDLGPVWRRHPNALGESKSRKMRKKDKLAFEIAKLEFDKATANMPANQNPTTNSGTGPVKPLEPLERDELPYQTMNRAAREMSRIQRKYSARR